MLLENVMASDDSLLPLDDQEILNFAEKIMLGSYLFSSWVLLANTNKNQTKKVAWDQALQWRKGKNGVREGERAVEPGDMPLMVRHSMIPDYLALQFFCLC